MAHGTTLHQKLLTVFVLFVSRLRSWYAMSFVFLEVASLNEEARKTLKSGEKEVNRRGPDVVVLRDHSESSQSSSESKDTRRMEKSVFRTKNSPHFVVIEVTSASTRVFDLTSR